MTSIYLSYIRKINGFVLNKNHVVKSNQVIEASYQLSAVEQRIVLAAISRIPKISLLQMMSYTLLASMN
jgi:hypothetical protein